MTDAGSPQSVCFVGSKRRASCGSQTSDSEFSAPRKLFLRRPCLPVLPGHTMGSRHLAFSLKQSAYGQAGHTTSIFCCMKLQKPAKNAILLLWRQLPYRSPSLLFAMQIPGAAEIQKISSLQILTIGPRQVDA